MGENGRGQLIAFRSDRLGGRLNCLVNTLRLYRRFGWEFSVVWPLAGDSYHTADINEPASIFSQEFVNERFVFTPHFRIVPGDSVLMRHLKEQSFDAIEKHLAKGGNVVVDLAFEIITLKGETEEEALAGYSDAFNSLSFAPTVDHYSKLISDRLQNATAYHLRRGDIISSIKTQDKPWIKKFVPDEVYRQHMDKELEDGSKKIVLFSDDSITIDRFRKQYPQMITFDDIVSAEDIGQGARDFLELYMMSRCKRIIAPPHSAFSSTAAELGQCDKISVLADLKRGQRDRAFRKVLQRLEKQPETFRSDGEVAQHFAHLHAWADDDETFRRIVDIQRSYIERGNNVAFMYSQLIEMMFRVGEFEAVTILQEKMAKAGLTQKKSIVESLTYSGLSDVKLGQKDKAISEFVFALWQARPAPRVLRDIIGILLLKGDLNDQNFFPVPWEITNQKTAKLFEAEKGFPHAQIRDILEVPDDWTHVVQPDPFFILWDFALGAFGRNYSIKRGQMPNGENFYLKSGLKYETREALAFAIFLKCLKNCSVEDHDYESMLREMLEEPHATPMIPYVLSRCQVLNGARWNDARESAELMMQMDERNLPGYRAWYAHTLLHTREEAQAAELFGSVAAEIPGLPGFYDDQCASFMRVKQYDNARQASLKSNERIAHHPNFLRSLSRAEEALGNLQAAADVLEDTIALDFTASRWIYYRMIEAQIKLGNLDRARSVLAQGRQRDPDWEKFTLLEQKINNPTFPK